MIHDDRRTNSADAERYIGATGAQAIHQALLAEAVEVIFGYPGAALLPLLDVLYDSPIQFILTRHEQGAGHMADAYARATGRCGVVLATSGPGATNLTTALATAYADGSPLVAITGQVRSRLLGTDAFQEADMTGITRAITKHNVLIRRPDELPRAIREAFHIARTGRPGPVLIDIPVDMTTGTIEDPGSLDMHLPGYRPQTRPHRRQIAAAVEALSAAARPVILAGAGAARPGSAELLRELCRRADIPAATTLLGIGAVDETDALSLGMAGMHGRMAANLAIQACDCLLAVGARLDERVTGDARRFAPRARIIHVDIDPSAIGKRVRADIPIVADAGEALRALLAETRPAERSAWRGRIDQWRSHEPRPAPRPGRIAPEQVIRRLGELTGHDATICSGVGQHQMWTAQHYGFRRPGQLITSGGMGTMGFGVPAAIGAQLARPGELVVDIDGDGSFSMTMMELISAVTYELPAKFVVLDNGTLGMVRQWQDLACQGRHSGVANPRPDFARIAERCGAVGIRSGAADELDEALAALLAADGPAVLAVDIEPRADVWPTVLAGAALHEMALSSPPAGSAG